MNHILTHRPVYQEIADYIRVNNLCQTMVAKKCGWSRQRLNAVLCGRNKLYADDMVKICDALSVPYDIFCKPVSR